jgi:hypothetical protein
LGAATAYPTVDDLIDSNIPMHLAGAPHPHKLDAQRVLENPLSEQPYKANLYAPPAVP